MDVLHAFGLALLWIGGFGIGFVARGFVDEMVRQEVSRDDE